MGAFTRSEMIDVARAVLDSSDAEVADRTDAGSSARNASASPDSSVCPQCDGAGVYQMLGREETGFTRRCAPCDGTGRMSPDSNVQTEPLYQQVAHFVDGCPKGWDFTIVASNPSQAEEIVFDLTPLVRRAVERPAVEEPK